MSVVTLLLLVNLLPISTFAKASPIILLYKTTNQVALTESHILPNETDGNWSGDIEDLSSYGKDIVIARINFFFTTLPKKARVSVKVADDIYDSVLAQWEEIQAKSILSQPWLTPNVVNWPVEFSHNIKEGQLFPLKLFDLDFVLWRDEHGDLRGALDTCPHRRSSLAEGTLNLQQGCLTCPYHQWQFNLKNGHCVDMFQQQDDSFDLGLAMAPLFEQGGLVWMQMSRAIHQSISEFDRDLNEETNLALLPILPSEFLSQEQVFVDDFSYDYEAPWHLVLASAIDNIFEFSTHKLAKISHAAENILSDDIKKLTDFDLETGAQFRALPELLSVSVESEHPVDEDFFPYWKMTAPGIWLSSFHRDFDLLALFVPVSQGETSMKVAILSSSSKNLNILSFEKIHSSIGMEVLSEDETIIKKQQERMRHSPIPVFHTRPSDEPLLAFYDYLFELFGAKLPDLGIHNQSNESSVD